MGTLSGEATLTYIVHFISNLNGTYVLTLLHSGRPKLYAILAFLSAIGLKKYFASLRSSSFVSEKTPFWKSF